MAVDRLGKDARAGFWARRLQETLRWCASRPGDLSPASRFRSDELDPALFLVSRELVAGVRRSETGDAVCQEPGIVTAIARRRGELLRHAPVAEIKPRGRVAVYQAGMNLLDRLAYDETAGFIDFSDCPGWDSWIGLLQGEPDRADYPGIQDALAFWVPREFEGMIEAANAVCSCPTLCWLEEFSAEICPSTRRALSELRG